VIKNNAINASADGSSTVNATGNWWGTSNPGPTITGATVDWSGYLLYEPLLTPAIDTADGAAVVTTEDIILRLADRNAVEMRLSEDSTFTGVYFEPFFPSAPFRLSPAAGMKTIFAQFRSPTGTESSNVSVTVDYITEGPQIQDFSLNEGQSINRPIPVTGSATAVVGIQNVIFLLDGSVLASTTSSSLSYLWDPRGVSTGVHRVELRAVDEAGRVGNRTHNVFVEPLPPPAPVITAPADGFVTPASTVQVSGTAEPGVNVALASNGFNLGIVIADPLTGAFLFPSASLREGTNLLYAFSTDSVGVSADSNSVNVIHDTGPPEPPELVSALARPDEGVRLDWMRSPIGEIPSTYRVYRSTTPLTVPEPGLLIVSAIRELGYTDSTAPEGVNYFGVTAVDGAGNESGLSNVREILYDKTVPGFSISYASSMPLGVGTFGFTITATEPISGLPVLTMTLSGQDTPDGIVLTRVDDVTFTGQLVVSTGMPSGPAVIRITGSDTSGNVFTGSPSGPDLVLDTTGPVGQVSVTEAEPIQVTESRSVFLTLTLDEPAKPATLPSLVFSPPSGSPVPVSLSGSGNLWSGLLPLEPTMGSGMGGFALSVFDALNNEGTSLSVGGTLEIYNTPLPPPPSAPNGFSAVTRPGGEVELVWNPVEKADLYMVYRKSGACDAVPTEVATPGGLSGTTFTDLPAIDGAYCYGVTAFRKGAESSMSQTLPAVSDRLGPGVPVNVTVGLDGTGIQIAWEAPGGETPAFYHVYRNGVSVGSITGGAGPFAFTDLPPDGGAHGYAVGAFDEAGNEDRSTVTPIDLTVGAVENLTAFVGNGLSPILAWASSDPSVAGFNVYRGGVLLNAAPILSPGFTDTSYSGAVTAVYSVTAFNGSGQESPGRTIRVRPVRIQASAIAGRLVARYFSPVHVSIFNDDASSPITVETVRYRASVQGTETVNITDSSVVTVSKISPYIHDFVLPVGLSQEAIIFEVTATDTELQEGTTVTYRSQTVLDGIDPSGVMVSLALNEQPLAGGLTTVYTCVHNNGRAAMDLVVNRNGGSDPGDLVVAVESLSGMLLSRTRYKDFPTGFQVFEGTGYMTIPAGEMFCADVTVLVPANLEAGSQVVFRGYLEGTIYDLPGVARPGLAVLEGTMRSKVTQSPYYGSAHTAKSVFSDDEPITISGQALDRGTGQPVPDVPLKVGFLLRGYKWYADVVTDASGDYTYTFVPTSGLSGEFTVWAAHPDVYDVLNQHRFRLFRAYAVPASGEIRSAKGDTLPFRIDILNPGDVPLSGLTLSFRAYTIDGTGAEIPEPGLTGQLVTGPRFQLAPGARATVDLELTASLDAPDSANVEYLLNFSEGASARFTGAVTLAPAVPVLSVKLPAAGFVETSVDRGSIRTVSVTLENKGLRPLLNARMTPPTTVTWITTNLVQGQDGTVSMGDVPVGGKVRFDVVLAPPVDEPFGYQNDRFEFTGDNSPQPFELPVLAIVTSNLTGNIQFMVTNVIDQKVKDADIRLRYVATGDEVGPITTDANGEALVSGLQEGRWSYQVVASGHKTETGEVTVVADQTVVEEVFPVKNLVTIDFRVEPVPFTDRYTITISQTFETHVPLPVLVLDPPFVNYQGLEAGFEDTFIVKVTNHGLIQINDLTISPGYAAGAVLQPLITYVPVLRPFETINVPYRFTYSGPPPALPGFDWGDYAGEVASCAAPGWGTGESIAILGSLKGSAFCATAGREIAMAQGLLVAGEIYGALTGDAIGLITSVVGCAIGNAGGGGGGGGGGWGGSGGTYGFAGGGACFAPGTPVRMADGETLDIESVREGELIMTPDGEVHEVTRTYARDADRIYDLRYRVLPLPEGKSEGEPNRRLLVTPEHLLKAVDGGWVSARDILPGDRLVLSQGRNAEVLENEERPWSGRVYSLDVEGAGVFFANDVLVRQRCGEAEPAKKELSLRKEPGSFGKEVLSR